METKSNRPEKEIVVNNTIDIAYKSQFYIEEEERLR
mgnify:CR=1 FL=1